jgi:hypothetical protein
MNGPTDIEKEYELEVTVHSMNVEPQPHFYYFPLDELSEGLSYVARNYGHYDQWAVVITSVYKRRK